MLCRITLFQSNERIQLDLRTANKQTNSLSFELSKHTNSLHNLNKRFKAHLLQNIITYIKYAFPKFDDVMHAETGKRGLKW